MKIAILHFGKKGAGPAYMLQMAAGLQSLGHEILYYASDKVENKEQVKAYRFNERFFSTYNSKLTYLKSIIFKKNINKIIKSLKEDNPDVIYSPMNDLWSPFIFPYLKDILRVKTIHDVGVHEGNNSIFNKWWNKTNFQNADKYVILSNIFIEELIKRGIARENICVIPHAGFDYYLNFNIKNINLIQDCDILFFGRIDKYKGINILLNAFELLLKKNPQTTLNIVGNGDLSEYKEIIHRNINNIRVLNRWIKDEEVTEIFPKTKIVVLPYTHATQSGVIPLSYAFAKPVIATDTGGLSEQILDGITGRIIEKDNPKVLADSILELLNNPTKLSEMGKNAHSYMINNLTWQSSANKLINFIINEK